MDVIEDVVRRKSLLRLSEIFHVPVESLISTHLFGVDLKASFISDFKRNELDQVIDDIHDVADRKLMRELGSERLIIKSVGDYCDHMVRCSKVKPKRVTYLLGMPAGTA